MSFNRRNGGSGFGGYSGGGRFNGGRSSGYRNGAAGGNVNPWQSNAGPMSRHSQQQQGLPPAHLANMATNIIKLLQSTNVMPTSGFSGSLNRSGYWGGNNSRMSNMGMRRQDGPGIYTKDNRRRSGEKFGTGRKSGLKDDKRKSGGKINDENKKGQNEREKTKEQMEADKKASYVGVPTAVLYCHVCSKHMWDAESFEKHVRGRPHELMITYLDEAYKMRVDFMRHQIKAVENQREIDLERVTNNKHKSNSNKTSTNPNASKPLLRSYCPMCDVRFYGPLTGHRKSDRHRKLKQFLHPECKLCDALFHTRLEIDEHKLTAGHLMKVAEMRNINHPQLKDDEFDLIDMIKIEEENNDDQDQMPIAKKYEMLGDRDANKLKVELEGGNYDKRDKKDSSANKGAVSNDGNEVKNTKSEVETSNIDAVKNSTALQTCKDEITTNKETFTYDPTVALGKDLLIPSKGYVCRLCNCFLLDQERVSIHCQTAAHYINYTTMTKMKDATSGGKKRGIEEVREKVVITDDDIIKANDNLADNNTECQEVTDSEESTVKRIKLDEKGTDVKMEIETDKATSQNIENYVSESSIEEKVGGTESPITTAFAQVVTTPKARGNPKCRKGGVARRGVRR